MVTVAALIEPGWQGEEEAADRVMSCHEVTNNLMTTTSRVCSQ